MSPKLNRKRAHFVLTKIDENFWRSTKWRMCLRKLPAFRHLWTIAIALLSTAGLVLILAGIQPVRVRTDFAGHTTQVITALSNQTVNLYSDLLIHHMGPGLADCMQLPTPLPTGGTQANGDQWRTAPLWGLSTRTVYLHAGRTTDLMTAIEMHSSSAGASACGNTYPDSEANQVIINFNALSTLDQGDLLAFINSL